MRSGQQVCIRARQRNLTALTREILQEHRISSLGGDHTVGKSIRERGFQLKLLGQSRVDGLQTGLLQLGGKIVCLSEGCGFEKKVSRKKGKEDE